MFAKKLLSLVTLLFAGSQIYRVSASCILTLTMGSNPGTDDECSLNNCPIGFYKLSGDNEETSTVFEIGESKTVKKYVKVYGSGENDCSEIDTVADPSYCAGGKFEIDSGKFCLDSSNTATLNDSKNYLFVDTDNLFGDGASAKVVIKSATDSFSFTKNADLTTEDYCVRNGIISDKLDMYCKGDCTYYNCNTGVCDNPTIEARETAAETPNTTKCNPSVPKPSADADTINSTDSAFHCKAGYYILNTGALFGAGTSPEVGTLYHCASDYGSSCDSITGASADIGYYKNAHENNPTVKYIQCDGTDCKAVFANLETSCTNAGELINDGAFKLCTLDLTQASTSIELAIASTGKYFVPVETTTGTIFSGIAVNGYSIVVEIDQDKATVLAKSSKKYRYTDNTNKIYDSADESVCGNGSNIYEYVLYKEQNGPADSYDYYKSDGAAKTKLA